MTKAEIREYIKNNTAAEFEADSIVYYLHISDDGKIVTSVEAADATFTTALKPEDYGMTQEQYQSAENPETVYSCEEDGNPIFEGIVDSLYEQAQKYLDEV